MMQEKGTVDPGLNALLHDRMDVRIAGYGEFVKTWEALIEDDFFTEIAELHRAGC